MDGVSSHINNSNNQAAKEEPQIFPNYRCIGGIHVTTATQLFAAINALVWIILGTFLPSHWIMLAVVIFHISIAAFIGINSNKASLLIFYHIYCVLLSLISLVSVGVIVFLFVCLGTPKSQRPTILICLILACTLFFVSVLSTMVVSRSFEFIIEMKKKKMAKSVINV